MTRTIIALMAAATVLGNGGGGAEDMFRLNFRATCRSLGANGRLDTTRLSERDIIEAATGVSGNATRQFTLVYNATSDSIQVATTNGTVVADVIQFQGGASTSDGRRSSRLTFMFVPNQTNAIGSAVINERAASSQNANGTNRAAISGIVQFALTDDITLGQTNITSTGTNSGLNVPISNNDSNSVTGTSSLGDTNSAAITNTVTDTNLVTGTNGFMDTNSISGTNTAGETNGTNSGTTATGNASNSGFFFSNSSLIQSNGLTNVRICVGTFSTTRRVSENVFSPVVNTNQTGNATNNMTGTNNVAGTNNVTGTNNVSGTNNISGTNNVNGTNGVSGIPGGTLGSPLTNLFSRIRP